MIIHGNRALTAGQMAETQFWIGRLHEYVSNGLNCLSRIMEQDPHREYTDPGMAGTEHSAEALAKEDLSEITKRLLEHDNPTKLLNGLYQELPA